MSGGVASTGVRVIIHEALEGVVSAMQEQPSLPHGFSGEVSESPRFAAFAVLWTIKLEHDLHRMRDALLPISWSPEDDGHLVMDVGFREAGKAFPDLAAVACRFEEANLDFLLVYLLTQEKDFVITSDAATRAIGPHDLQFTGVWRLCPATACHLFFSSRIRSHLL